MSNPIFDNPSFLKAMAADDSNTRKKIPPPFNKFAEKIGRDVVLRIQEGRQWKIKMRIVGEEMYFARGWKSFIKKNKIAYGDFLVFLYDGQDGFDVKIFGKSGCEKEEPDGVVNQGISVPGASRKRKARALGKSRNNLCYKVLRGLNEVANEIALEAAHSVAYTHRHFISTCRKTHDADKVRIPIEAVEDYKLDERNFIPLQDPNGTLWSVKLTGWTKHRRFLCWDLFYKGNALQEEDVCVFEFVDEGSKINVHIFRVQDYPAKQVQNLAHTEESGNKSWH